MVTVTSRYTITQLKFGGLLDLSNSVHFAIKLLLNKNTNIRMARQVQPDKHQERRPQVNLM